MISISKDKISDKMFFIREEDSNQPIAVIKVGDLMKFERPQSEITEEDIQNAIKAGYENGYSMAQAKYQRPQGEWIIDNYGMYHCNYCMKEKQQLFNNFCSFCGADMRGGKNENH